MRVEIREYKDHWQDIKDATMTTISKDTGLYPTREWKRRLLLSEHSPIRKLTIGIKVYDVPYWVAMHFRTHKIGIEHFISTQRTDRTGVDRSNLPQGSLVNWEFEANAQAIINISKKRLCHCSSKETREVWEKVLLAIAIVEPELVSVCVPDCVYRGDCFEMFPCGFCNSKGFKEKLKKYKTGVTHEKI